ncbi:tubulin polyglutamylase complex subunit 1-like [Mizuhopecten yessoensis]|uniref:Tubulin polyglutamylase complex subunit 1 n=1 Tax=Mizuhopecten yessoensis TaxID=6573 RepID=A0A210Q028_MIZYE|nr:tubulin polyglutamylase complex subunit 1-like [Mizuhopecten yessoensis]OWF42078.1 Tubulin polyglutamylase complex subunit 1 [Mizuhopecten yessoensis]
MADKKKPNSADDRIVQETDRQFLERTSTGTLIKDVLEKVISNRPEDPIAFLADYFDSLEDETNLVSKAKQILLMTHHSRPVFETNVRMAYNLLQKHKVTKKVYGVNGTVYTDLIKALCKDVPQTVQIKLLKRIECAEHECIKFDVFCSGVFTSCVLLDYVKLSEMLFKSIDLQKSGKADKVLCETVLDQLRTALASNKSDARRVVESGYNLGPDGLYYALDKAMKRGNLNHGAQTLDQFTTEACDAFLTKVKKLR